MKKYGKILLGQVSREFPHSWYTFCNCCSCKVVNVRIFFGTQYCSFLRPHEVFSVVYYRPKTNVEKIVICFCLNFVPFYFKCLLIAYLFKWLFFPEGNFFNLGDTSDPFFGKNKKGRYPSWNSLCTIRVCIQRLVTRRKS